MKTPVIGMDIAKDVFQLHAVDVASGKVERVKLKRGEVVDFFAKRERSIARLKPVVALTIGPGSWGSLVMT